MDCAFHVWVPFLYPCQRITQLLTLLINTLLVLEPEGVRLDVFGWQHLATS
jgi:hypothetical protein